MHPAAGAYIYSPGLSVKFNFGDQPHPIIGIRYLARHPSLTADFTQAFPDIPSQVVPQNFIGANSTEISNSSIA
jgi:hypothetical protein